MKKRCMKKSFTFLLAGCMLFMTACGGAADTQTAGNDNQTEAVKQETVVETKLPKTEGKPRLLVTQDGEVDDMNTLIHTLLYANDIDLEGIVQTSSKLHYSGDGQNEALRWMGTDWMYEFLDAYAEVYDNLVVHDPEYPAPEKLRAITKVGNVKMVDDTSEETEGSNLVKERILAEDDRPLYIEIGGGANTVARALMSIEEEYKDSDEWEKLHERISEKVILFAWGAQDTCYVNYLKPNWPAMRMINVSGSTIAYGYKWALTETLSDEAKAKMSSEWMVANLVQNRGALLDKYVTWGDGTYLEGEEESDQYGTNEALLNTEDWWGQYAYQRYDFLSEGDSPAWFAVIPNGLRSLEDLSYGGWAGRYDGNADKDDARVRYYQASNGEQGMARWVEAIQSDFAMRAKWCVESNFANANHLPVVTVEEGIDLEAGAGDTVTLHAAAEDPDGDTTAFQWYQYALADTYAEAKDAEGNLIELEVAVSGDNGSQAQFTVPKDAKKGDTIHIILEGVDGGGTNPTAYQRIIITVK